MFTLEVVLLYLLWLISFYAMGASVRNSGKVGRWLVIFLYLAVAAPFTYLLIAEIVSPSEDANIGLGLAYYLMQYVSIGGLIVVVLAAMLRYVSRK